MAHRFWDTPVVKSSSRELCYIILAGICLGYLCTFSLIAKPHIIYCYLQRLGIGLSPAMSYSALVTKVSSLSRATVVQPGHGAPHEANLLIIPGYLEVRLSEDKDKSERASL